MSDNNPLHKGNLMPSTNWLPIVIITSGVVIAAIAAVFLYAKLQDKGVIDSVDVPTTVKNPHVPMDYFINSTSNEKNDEIYLLPNAKEETAIDPKRGYYINGNYIEPNEEVAVLQSHEPPKVESVTVEEPLTTDKAFTYPPQPTQQQLLELRRSRLNAKRRSSSEWKSISTIESIEEKKRPLTPPKDKDFSAHEDIGKDESTFPVDLERVVTADRYIPCVLTDQINSQLTGRVTCTVERNVFGFHGRKILIPAGSRAMGRHETLKKVGDERFDIIWTRILRPDGVHIALTDAYSSDRVGASGIEGVINNRRWEKYGGALLTSTVSAVMQMSIPVEGSNNTRIAMESYGTDIGRVSAAMLQETMNIKPYGIVPSGERINITPTTDIWLKDTKRGAMFAPVE